MDEAIDGFMFYPLSRVSTPGGDVLHGCKTTDSGYRGFGEVYFSFVEAGAIKGWKRHQKMTLNLMVPVGSVRFVAFDDRPDSPTSGSFQELVVSEDRNYGRLTVAPGLWLGFQGLSAGINLVCNLADLAHDPGEVDRLDLTELDYSW